MFSQLSLFQGLMRLQKIEQQIKQGHQMKINRWNSSSLVTPVGKVIIDISVFSTDSNKISELSLWTHSCSFLDDSYLPLGFFFLLPSLGYSFGIPQQPSIQRSGLIPVPNLDHLSQVLLPAEVDYTWLNTLHFK